MDLQLFAERDGQQRKALEQRTADLHAARSQAEALQAALDESNAQGAELLAEVERLQGSASAQLELGERAEAERKMAAMRAEIAEVELRRDRAAHADHAERVDAKHAMLATRLEGTLRELQGVVAERDSLAAKLEEALGRCTSSLVAKQLAEDACKAAQQQLDALRTAQIS